MPLPLYDFQREDVEKLLEVPAGLLGSDMGSGKTLISVEMDNQWGYQGAKTLVVAPLTSLETTWVRWFHKQAPNLKVVFCNSKKRAEFAKQVASGEADVYIVHWEAIRLLPELAMRRWSLIIADECQRMKNRKSQQTRALKKLKSDHRLALSGTAADNKPTDIWSTLNWLYPSRYTSYWRWYKKYVDFEVVYPQGFHKVKGIKPEMLDEYLKEIEPFYVRHLKREKCCDKHPSGVMPWLPDKYYTPLWVDLDPVQRKAYDQMRKTQIAWVGEHEDTPLVAPVVISQLQRLQQFALCHMRVDDEDRDHPYKMCEPSSKLDLCIEVINATTEPVVVFSQFKQIIVLLEARLAAKKITYALITGDVKPADRAKNIEAFQEGKIHVMAGTIAAGGVGIDLFKSSTVIFLDRAWSPAMNIQAEDRLWRDGQKNAVQVFDIMARNTVDYGRKQSIDQKWVWLKQMFGDDTTSMQIAAQEEG